MSLSSGKRHSLSSSSSSASSSSPGEKGKKLRTSEDVYHKLLWQQPHSESYPAPVVDGAAFSISRVNPARVMMGYEDRMVGMVETSLMEWKPIPEGDIPWHRVWYFRTEDLLLWDRDARIDFVFNSGEDHSFLAAPPLFSLSKYSHAAENTARLKSQSAGKAHAGKPPALRSGKGKSQASTSLASTPAAAPGNAVRKLPTAVQAIPAYTFDAVQNDWVMAPPDRGESRQANAFMQSCIASRSVSLVTFNILFDLYMPERIETAQRIPQIMNFLHGTDADVIVLEEVTQPFHEALLDQRWVRNSYSVSDLPGGATLQPFGQLLLTRLPVDELFIYPFSETKRVVGARIFATSHERCLKALAVHLTSNKHGDASAKRFSQLDAIVRDVCPGGDDTVVLGDFNMYDHEALPPRLQDVWPALHPSDPGHTFNPSTNPLAQMISTTGNSGRLDRVMIYNARKCALAPAHIEMLATKEFPVVSSQDGSITSLTMSDHYALKCVLRERDDALLLDDDDNDDDENDAAAAADDEQPALGLAQSPALSSSSAALVAAASAAAASLRMVHKSAVCLIPSAEVWAPIQAIRALHDKSYSRWMPHINLVYGFVPDEGDNFTEAATAFGAVLEHAAPFTVTLSEFDYFQHGRSVTVFLKPQVTRSCALDPATLEQIERAAQVAGLSAPERAAEAERRKAQHEILCLQGCLERQYPQCNEQSSRSAKGFTPHLTVAQFPSLSEAQKHIRAWQRDWSPITFQVRSVSLISRFGEEPFAVRQSVRLGGASDTGDLDLATAASASGVTDAPEGLKAFVHRALNKIILGTQDAQPKCAFPIGSHQLGVAGAQSDLDVVCIGPHSLSRDAFFSMVVDHFESSNRVKFVRTVTLAVVPVAKVALKDGSSVDILYCRLPSGVDVPCAPYSLKTRQLKQLDQESMLSVYGWLENDALQAAVGPSRMDLFKSLLLVVKQWARCKNIYSSAFGYLGGFSWAVLVAAFVVRVLPSTAPTRQCTAEDAAQFFQFVQSWPWPKPLFVVEPPGSGAGPGTAQEKMPIMTTAVPFRSSSRTVTKSTFSAIMGEVGQALESLRAGATDHAAWVSRVCQPAEFTLPFKGFLAVQIQCVTEDELERNLGWLTSKLVALVGELEKCRVHAVPHPRLIRNIHRVYGELEPEDASSSPSQRHRLPLCNFPFTVTGIVGVAKDDVGDARAPDYTPALVVFRGMYEGFSARGVATNMEIMPLKQASPLLRAVQVVLAQEGRQL